MPSTSVLIPSNIPESAVIDARSYFNQGLYAQAWNALAQGGDRYADNAAGVLGRNQDSADFFFQKLVQHYWDNTVPGAYSDKFNVVARDHLNKS